MAKRLFGERGMASLNHNFYISERDIFLRGELDSSGKTGGVFSFARGVVAATLAAARAAIGNEDDPRIASQCSVC
jgi:hypothetical protein